MSSMSERSISLLSQEHGGWCQKGRRICTLLRGSKYVRYLITKKQKSPRHTRQKEARNSRLDEVWFLVTQVDPLLLFVGGQVHILPSNVSLEQGALCEPLSCILHGWHRLKMGCSVQAQSKILILGAGIIGNLWSCLLHHYGLRKVIVSEPSLERRMITEGLG